MLAICLGGVIPDPTPIIPDGETVTPTDNVATWVECAGITKPYTNLTQILEDVVTLSAIVSDENAVDYMVRSTTWADTICSDQNAMNYIGLSNYCANTLLSDETWCEAICDSEYFESVLNAKVPIMTSNTEPIGEVRASSEGSWNGYTHYAWKAFDGSIPSEESSWGLIAVNDAWIEYEAIKPYAARRLDVLATGITSFNISPTFYIYGSNDGINYDLLKTITGNDAILKNDTTFSYILENNTEYKIYRLRIKGAMYKAHTTFSLFASIQFYGRKDL